MKRILTLLLLIPLFSVAQFVPQKVPYSQWGHLAGSVVYVPKEAKDSVNKRYPTMLFFHGVGQAVYDKNGQARDINVIYTDGLPQLIKNGMIPSAINPETGKQEEFIVIAVHDNYWSPAPVPMRYALDSLMKKYPIDSNRIGVTGLSSGGMESLQFACWDSSFAKKISWAVVCSPAVLDKQAFNNLYLFGKYGIPVVFYVGLRDNEGPFLVSATQYHNAIIAASGTSTLLTFDGGHCCWNNVYNKSVKMPWKGQQVDLFQFGLVNRKIPITYPPVPDSTKVVQILHDPSKVRKIIVFDLDGTYKEYEGNTIDSGWIKLTTL